MHWHDLPIALAPTPNSVDEYGVVSGCAFDADGVPTVLYTGVRQPVDGPRIELPCVATSNDADLVTWQTHPTNPVIAGPPPGFDILGFRDHAVWKEAGAWYQIIGSGIRGVGGTGFCTARLTWSTGSICTRSASAIATSPEISGSARICSNWATNMS